MFTAEDDIWEVINSDEAFNEFVGKAITHFVHFVVPRRDQTAAIKELYQIPEEFKELPALSVEIEREPQTNEIFIRFANRKDGE